MKITKTLLILMVLASMIVVGCKKSDEEKATNATTKAKTEVTKEAEKAPDATADITKEAEKKVEDAKSKLEDLGK